MSALAARVIGLDGLRISILAADPQRRRALADMVAAAGHAIALASAGADAVLADGVAAPADGPPVLALGATDGAPAHAGLLPRDATPVQIDAALRAVAAGLVVRPPDEAAAGFAPLAEEAPLLTPREVEILAAIGEGLSNKTVARRLGISPHTVKFHVESLFRKLGAVSRADAVAKGLRRQILHL